MADTLSYGVVDNRGLVNWNKEFTKEPWDPAGFGNHIHHDMVLRFGARVRDGRMSLGRQGYKRVAEVHMVTGRRTSSVGQLAQSASE